MTQKLEENGHLWVFTSRGGCDENTRCVYCSMRLNYYLAIKKASKEQPRRKDLREWMKCPQTRKPKS